MDRSHGVLQSRGHLSRCPLDPGRLEVLDAESLDNLSTKCSNTQRRKLTGPDGLPLNRERRSPSFRSFLARLHRSSAAAAG